ncbi:hypothetical protein [Kitasatospora sp. NPDC015120]|uniref:hypothetical protein n=1 Tax=Kitasatospora sp. NPDC015120 TaxID=3364023 RepID=UPI0036F49F03
MNPEHLLHDLIPTPTAPAGTTEPDDTFDVPAELRRISADVARIRRGQQPPPGWWAEQQQARQCLEAVVATELSTTPLARIADLAALADLADLVEQPAATGSGRRRPRHRGRVEDITQEIEGFRLFGCVLYLAGHPVSAEFWWKIGAGARDRTSAWCLYLHHLGRGEIGEARLWFEQSVQAAEGLAPGVPAPAVPDMPDYFRTAPIAMDTRTAAAAAPVGALAREVDRLVMHTGDDTDGLVSCPDRRLADRLEEYAGLS